MDYTNVAISILKEQAGELDIKNKTYLLQTPDAYLILSFDEEEQQVNVNVTGGNIEVFQTNKRPFKFLFGSEDEE